MKLKVNVVVARIMLFSFRRDIQATVQWHEIIRDPKQVSDVLNSANATREVMEERVRCIASN